MRRDICCIRVPNPSGRSTRAAIEIAAGETRCVPVVRIGADHASLVAGSALANQPAGAEGCLEAIILSPALLLYSPADRVGVLPCNRSGHTWSTAGWGEESALHHRSRECTIVFPFSPIGAVLAVSVENPTKMRTR